MITISRHDAIFAALLVLVIFLEGCNREPRYHSQGGLIVNGDGYDGMWTEYGELRHLVIRPPYAEGQRTAVTGRPPSRPDTTGIASYSNALYLNGTPVDLSVDRVFVFTIDQKVLPVPLAKEELELLTPDAMRTVCNLPFWKDKIQPVVDVEEERWKEWHFSRTRRSGQP